MNIETTTTNTPSISQLMQQLSHTRNPEMAGLLRKSMDEILAAGPKSPERSTDAPRSR